MLLSTEILREANEAFKALVGLPLTRMWRYLSYERFEFGEQKPAKDFRGRDVMRDGWALTAICEWRIEGPQGFCLTDDHFGSARSADYERQDEHAAPFYERLKSDPPVVESVEVLPDGAVRIVMTHGFSLSLSPLPGDWDVMDDWRLMPPIGDPRGHLVLDRGHLGWSG